MPHGYATQGELFEHVQNEANDRCTLVRDALRTAFGAHIRVEPCEIISFADVSARDIATAILDFPQVLKPLLLACNLAARAVERDLDIRNLDTYAPRLDSEQAHQVAGYLRPFLPPYVTIDALCVIDRCAFVDKEIRRRKGQWEQGVREALGRAHGSTFRKR